MESLDQSHSANNNWRVVAIVLAFLTAGLAAGLLYLGAEHSKLADNVDQLAAERDDLQRQVDTQNGDIEAHAPDTTFTSAHDVEVIITSPLASSTISSPLSVSGEVPGSWSQEAQFTVLLRDGSGNTVARANAILEGEWQTEGMVPFSVTLEWTGSHTGNATLVLEKANPSGLAENNDSVEVPLQF